MYRGIKIRRIFSIICAGMLLILLGSGLQAKEKKIFDPYELDPFINGEEEPAKDMEILLRFSSVAPEGSVWASFIRQGFKRISKAFNDLIKLKFYPGGVLGDEADNVRKMKMKQIHAVACTNMGLTMMVPNLCVLELPFLFDWEPDLWYYGKFCQIDYIMKKMTPTIDKLSMERGFMLMAISESALNFVLTQIPLKKVEDFEKLTAGSFRGDRIRPEINKVFKFKKLVSTQIFDAGQLLQTGVIDCSPMGGFYATIALQMWPYFKYVTDYPLYGYESASGHFDKRAMAKLKAFVDKWGHKWGLKDGEYFIKTVHRLGFEIGKELCYATRTNEKKARDELINKGYIKAVKFPDEEREKLKQRVLPLYDKLADDLYPKWVLDEILQYREEYRKLKKEGKMTKEWYKKMGVLPSHIP